MFDGVRHWQCYEQCIWATDRRRSATFWRDRCWAHGIHHSHWSASRMLTLACKVQRHQALETWIMWIVHHTVMYVLKSEASVCPCPHLTLPSDRLRCCDRYIWCQRSLAVKPLNSRDADRPSHRPLLMAMWNTAGQPASQRSGTGNEQVSVYPCTISDCSCWAWAMAVSKLIYAWCQLTQWDVPDCDGPWGGECWTVDFVLRLMPQTTILQSTIVARTFLGHIVVLHTYIRPIVTDGVMWSVGLSLLWSLQKTAEPIEMLFGLKSWIGPANHVWDGDPDTPMGRGSFGVKGRPL